MNLFEIQANIDRILEYAAENGGDIGESNAEELAISEEELGEKLYAYAFVIDRYNTDIALLKQYKQALRGTPSHNSRCASGHNSSFFTIYDLI